MVGNPSFWPFKILILPQKMPYLAQDYKSWPFSVKKIFVSDSTQIFFVKSLGHKDCMFRISSKSETIFFSFSKGGPFGVFPIFKVSIWRYWLTFMDINGEIDSFECWNSGVNGCLNIKNFIWEQVLGVSATFCWVI